MIKKFSIISCLSLAILSCSSCKKKEDVQNFQKFSGPRVTITIGNVKFDMVRIKAGDFMMGSDANDPYWNVAGYKPQDNELPKHKVTIPKDFYIATTECTRALWKEVMGIDPSKFTVGHDGTDYFEEGKDVSNYPVEGVSWTDIVEKFLPALNRRPESTYTATNGKKYHRKYRLPTEAEWEYACRAGNQSMFCFGDDASTLDHYAWYKDNVKEYQNPTGLRLSKTPQEVGKKTPNAWGLYDMHGNVGEWVHDYLGAYPKDHLTDPIGPTTGERRVIRGGAFDFSAALIRSAVRDSNTPISRLNNTGFRLAIDVDYEE